jgi:hypothetical protein
MSRSAADEIASEMVPIFRTSEEIPYCDLDLD